jgi:predicted nucleic acid-binding protein
LALFAHFKAVLGSAVTSELMLAEPLAATSERHVMKAEARKSLFIDLLVRGGFIDPRPVTLAILVESATVPRDTDGKHSLPDAIHIATAAGRALFVTHDRRIRAVPPAITIVRPDASGVAAILDGSRV